jgi:hypothetical protein
VWRLTYDRDEDTECDHQLVHSDQDTPKKIENYSVQVCWTLPIKNVYFSLLSAIIFIAAACIFPS